MEPQIISIVRSEEAPTMWEVRVKYQDKEASWYVRMLHGAFGQDKFRIKCMERFNILPHHKKKLDWERDVITALARGAGLVD